MAMKELAAILCKNKVTYQIVCGNLLWKESQFFVIDDKGDPVKWDQASRHAKICSFRYAREIVEKSVKDFEVLLKVYTEQKEDFDRFMEELRK